VTALAAGEARIRATLSAVSGTTHVTVTRTTRTDDRTVAEHVRTFSATGHQDIGTTERYMHRSPAAKRSAIDLLEQSPPTNIRGGIVEEELVESVK
jgi:hypothetical protein